MLSKGYSAPKSRLRFFPACIRKAEQEPNRQGGRGQADEKVGGGIDEQEAVKPKGQ
jgi:hypothetical protein